MSLTGELWDIMDRFGGKAVWLAEIIMHLICIDFVVSHYNNTSLHCGTFMIFHITLGPKIHGQVCISTSNTLVNSFETSV